MAKGYYAEDLADAWERCSRYTATDDQSPQASHVADRVADEGDPSATWADQQELLDVADVADVAAERLNGAVCTECGQLLDLALVAAGFSTHGDERQR